MSAAMDMALLRKEWPENDEEFWSLTSAAISFAYFAMVFAPI
jgi:hypothetical protein